MHILGAHTNIGRRNHLSDFIKRCKWRANHHIDIWIIRKFEQEVFDKTLSFAHCFVHLPVSGDNWFSDIHAKSLFIGQSRYSWQGLSFEEFERSATACTQESDFF